MSDDEHAPGHASFQMRACEHCRQRKIKCDRKAPCASCRSLQIECRPSAKSAAVRTRTAPASTASQSDRQMYIINQRLASIEDSLKKLTASSISSPIRPSDTSSPNIEDSPASALPTFDGESSFEVQTLQASEAANRTVSQVFGHASNVQLKTAISSLISSLEAHNLDARAHDAYLSSIDTIIAPEALPLPPADIISAIVKKVKTNPPMILANLLPRGLSYMEQLCQKCYFPSASLPSGSRALLFALLFFTMRDYVNDEDSGFSPAQLQPSMQLCEQNFYRSVESYTTLTVPTLENTAALFLAAMRAHEESKVHLVWTYTSAAATMCYSLGFHRRSTVVNDPLEISELKRQVFWNIYMTDKNLSLNLGRRSNFCDDDIDQDVFPVSEDPRQRPLDQLNNIFIKYGVVQGRVYDELYSPKAANRPPSEKKVAVEYLGRQILDIVENEMKTLEVSQSWFPEALGGMLAASDAMAYTTLTTIYRAQTNTATGTEISSECFAYAKMALEAHVRFTTEFVPENDWAKESYVTWVLLYMSFTPYIIHFTWTISTLDVQDLNLLEQSVTMLDRFKHISKGSLRLRNVCGAFLETAKVLVQSQHSLSGIHQHDDGSLMFTDVMNSSAPSNLDWNAWSQAFPTMDRNADMSMFLNNWLGDNRPVMDMLGLDAFDQSRPNR
ncbi:hypothetical protein K461DRAFT_14042 [Myriangium duriaei CBS 260.36]|uniref:Zn(2)-C6 fungal-type domain-containing protein n=1 Tax=Myriangium duriaei CBS 260.36 TaxID=1168546 RepID=A0A9P4MPI6_9PEZI|nr:hypothetical protein K461DRAFT_14042 [Myriangium duriaei CBS 260.36]